MADIWLDVTGASDFAASPLDIAILENDRATISLVREALQKRRVMLAYQPVMRGNDLTQVAFHEGLVRLTDETGRVIPARDFMATVETTEIGRLIDCAALELGLETLRREPAIRLSINMSARSIGYPRWTEILRHGLAADDTAGERLILEITESSAMLMPEIVTTFMAELQRKGISFALDDFGSGYTAFRYFREFFFDIVKIDGQFIRGVARDPDSQVLTQALLMIARQFDMFAVAEEVETPEDAAWLQEQGVDFLQGYLFGLPTTTPVWSDVAARQSA
ncbi:MAG: EAL domain-containing protein [Cereibacter sphaeroides]|uniref:EAL domain-containing protein n=1 Tax=Cereibacter sphaeroides TaxID=1063 RepID=A0A2W5TQA3_CERSP|nr:MAG: EAL domain-containing protein [Cereibacter sphaeroides]